MSELSNNPSTPEEIINSEESSSSRTMFVTLILLIAGLLLASAMMTHYASKKINSNHEITFDFSALIEKVKTYDAALQKSETSNSVQSTTTANTKDSGIGNLFKNRGNKVHWPKLKLTGFGSSTDGRGGFAIINGAPVHPGQLINGKVKLDQIRTHDVIVEYMGETKILTVNIKD